MEDRSPLFDIRHVPQASIHLGIDFWVPAGTDVICPTGGKVMLARPKNKEKGGWGGRIDIYHNSKVWIFGHLKSENLPNPGDTISTHQKIGILGTKQENGGWLPHLHLQVMTAEEYHNHFCPEGIDAYSEPRKDLKIAFPNPLLELLQYQE